MKDKYGTVFIRAPRKSSYTGYGIWGKYTEVAPYAFYDYNNINRVWTGAEVKKIGDFAFAEIESEFVLHIHNPNTVFDGDNIFANSPNVTIFCSAGSTAEAYAIAHGIAYEYFTLTETGSGATCTENGSIKYACERCGYTLTVESDALGHNFGDWVTVSNPTIGVAGVERQTCTVCGDYVEREIPAIEATPNAIIIVSGARVQRGKTFSVDVSIENNIGLGGAEFSILFDNATLTLGAVDTSNFPANYTATPLEIANANGKLSFAATQNYTKNGTVATLTFTVNAESTAQESAMNVEIPAGTAFIYDGNAMKDVIIDKSNSTVRIYDYITGDADGNGSVNVRDVALILQFLADWDVTINQSAADGDKNGELNIRDAVRILQYITGWSVTLD